jgi:hypothetical protein
LWNNNRHGLIYTGMADDAFEGDLESALADSKVRRPNCRQDCGGCFLIFRKRWSCLLSPRRILFRAISDLIARAARNTPTLEGPDLQYLDRVVASVRQSEFE